MGRSATQLPASKQTVVSRETAPAKSSTGETYDSGIGQFAGMSPQKILQLQQTIGNRAVMQLLKSMQGASVAQTASSKPEETDSQANHASLAKATAPVEEAESLHEEQEEFYESLTDIRKPIKLGNEQHHLCIEMIDGTPEIGIHSDWSSLEEYVNELLIRMNKIGKMKNYDALYEKIIDAHKEGMAVIKQWTEALSDRHSRTLAPFINAQYEQKLSPIIDKIYDLLYQFDPEDVEEAEKYGKIVSVRKVDTTADPSKYTYHTGESNDPIPIVWYKAPTDYKNIVIKGLFSNITLSPFGSNQKVSFNGEDYQFGVEPANRVEKGTVLRKGESDGNRGTQQYLNKVLQALGYPMSNEDGDHVTDLGFGGADEIGNFWPLNSTINRSAFFKYNPSYVVNYIKGTQYVAAGIGSLVGKYFEVIGYESGAIPAESNTAKAGGTPK